MTLTPELILADLESELAATRRVLERVPDDKLDWKPHAKSMSLGALAKHIVDVTGLQFLSLTTDEFDYLAGGPRSKEAGSRQALLDSFDKNAAAVTNAVKSADPAALAAEWTFRAGDAVILKAPRFTALRIMGVGHIAHHRGQLTVYLRMLDVPLPSVYGPTADT